MKSVCSCNGSSSLLFVMKVMMISHVVSNSHKVMVALIVMFLFKLLLWRLFYNFMAICSSCFSRSSASK
jgi:hypothetical protein